MTELREIKLAKLEPNPFRDGGGGNPPATWESVAEAYGYDEEKLKQLSESYRTNGMWAGVIVREHPKTAGLYQLAFGHHRVEAARRAGLERIPVIVEDLSDDQMLQRMAAENSEEYGHDFSLGVLNAVEAVVRAYLAGKVELPKPIKTRFVSSLSNEERPFTPLTVGQFLGWTHPDPSNGTNAVRAADKVHVALTALDLIEQGALKRTQLKGLGASQARELITVTRRAMEAEAAKHEVAAKAYEERAAKARKDGDKRAEEKATEKLKEVAIHLERAKVAAGKQAVATVVNFHKESESFAEAARKAAEKLGVPAPKAKSDKKLGKELASVDELIERLDRVLRFDDPSWDRAILIAQEQGPKKTFRLLEESLGKLAERVKERAAELQLALRKSGK